jgi:PadR family transcriptional regulator PadR
MARSRSRSHSRQTQAILAELLADPVVERYGFELARATGLASGTLYPILMRLEERGLLEARWDISGGRPRHVYRLTAEGLRVAQDSRAARPASVRGNEALA